MGQGCQAPLATELLGVGAPRTTKFVTVSFDSAASVVAQNSCQLESSPLAFAMGAEAGRFTGFATL